MDADVLLVTLSVGRPGVERAEAAALPAEDLLSRLLVCVERRAEVPLLLFDMLEGLVDVGLLPFCSQNGGVETGEL